MNQNGLAAICALQIYSATTLVFLVHYPLPYFILHHFFILQLFKIYALLTSKAKV